MESYKITKQPNTDQELNSLDSKINFNRDLFRKELETLNTKGINLNFGIDELSNRIRSVETGESIPDFISYKDKSYSLYISKNKNNDSHRLDIFNEKENFNTNRSGNPHIAGWVGQAEFVCEDFPYHSENHWGVSVAEELKGSGLADLLYDLKCQSENQLEFEHVSADNLHLLTFYIKKGYVPYSIIKPDSINKEIIDKNELNKIILELKKYRENKGQPQSDGSALKLKLDPKEAMIIYSEIKTSI